MEVNIQELRILRYWNTMNELYRADDLSGPTLPVNSLSGRNSSDPMFVSSSQFGYELYVIMKACRCR